MMEINGPERVRFGPYEVDLHTHELWKHGIRVKLVGQPFEILATLVTRPGQLVTREQLRSQLWPGDTFVDFDHGLNAAVNKLRDVLCDSAEDPRYIETLPRRGYRFVAAVEKVRPAPVPEKATAATPVEPPLAVKPAEAKTSDEPQERETAAAPVVSTPLSDTSAAPQRRRWPLYVTLAVLVFSMAVWVVVSELSYYFKTEAEKRESAENTTIRTFTPLTSLSDPTSDPAFSPDGNRVAFRRESFIPGVAGIYVKQIGSEELRQLTSDNNDRCPVWSPDGKRIAFSRASNKDREILEVPAEGGATRLLYATGLGTDHEELDWSPNGNWIAFAGRTLEGRTTIYLLSLESLKARPVTMPTAGASDWGPAFSPDGERIAFVRSGNTGHNLMLMPSGGGEVRQLSALTAQLTGAPAWSWDGKTIIFGATQENKTGLFRVADDGGVPQAIREIEGQVWHPAVSRRGFLLAFQRVLVGRSISQLDLSPAGQKPRGLMSTVSGENSGAQFSPDGRRLVFISDRTGGLDLWMVGRDGQNPSQLTAIGTAGSPRWSPDGKEIVFDVGLGREWQQPRAIFTMNADGGSPRSLVQDNHNNPAPSWSRDGQWVYFASDRSGDWQLWKVQKEGGTPVQVTRDGGFAGWEGPDGYVYYAKHRYDNPELWRVPLAGGSEAPVYPPVRPLDWAAWMAVEKGIFYVEIGPGNEPTISFFDFSTLRVSHLATLDRNPFWLGATADGQSLVFDQPEDKSSHIVLRANFR